jgi:hypothetical protein
MQSAPTPLTPLDPLDSPTQIAESKSDNACGQHADAEEGDAANRWAHFYRLFPDTTAVGTPWIIACAALYNMAYTKPVLASRDGLRWVCPADAAMIPPAPSADASGGPSTSTASRVNRQLLAEAFGQLGVDMPACPPWLITEFITHVPELELLTPVRLRRFLRTGTWSASSTHAVPHPNSVYPSIPSGTLPTHATTSPAALIKSTPSLLDSRLVRSAEGREPVLQPTQLGSPEDLAVQELLKYAFRGLETAADFEQLLGVPCIPLSNGGWDIVRRGSASAETLLVCTPSEHRLLQHVPALLVHPCTASDALAPLFTRSELLKLSQMEALTGANIGCVLHRVIPTQWGRGAPVPSKTWRSARFGEMYATEWMSSVWTILGSYVDAGDDIQQLMASLQGLPLLFGSDGGLYPINLEEGPKALAATDRLPQPVQALLSRLGCVHVLQQATADADNLATGAAATSTTSTAATTKISAAMLHMTVNDDTQQGVLKTLLFAANHRDGSGTAALPEIRFWFRDAKIDHADRRLLFNFLSASHAEYSTDELDFVSGLPVFELHVVVAPTEIVDDMPGGRGTTSPPPPRFVQLAGALEGKVTIPPKGLPASLLSAADFIVCSESQYAFLDKVGVTEMHVTRFLSEHGFAMLPSLAENERNAWMLEVLQQVPLFEQRAHGWSRELRAQSFIPDREGKLQRPDQLWDPAIADIECVLGSGAYPALQFCAPELLGTLKILGLRTYAGIAAVHRAIDDITSAPIGVDVCARASALLQFLEANADGLRAEADAAPGGLAKLCDTLRTNAWIVPAVEPVHELIRWFIPIPASGVMRPDQLRPPADAWLVAAEMRVPTVEVRSAVALELLGWDGPIPARIAARQLTKLSNAQLVFATEHARSALPLVAASGVSAPRDDAGTTDEPKSDAILQEHAKPTVISDAFETPPIFCEAAGEAVLQIYALLAEHVSAGTAGDFGRALTGTAWIWIGGSVVSSDAYAFDHIDALDGKVTPWMNTYEDQHRAWTTLGVDNVEIECIISVLKECAIKDTFDTGDYVAVLHRMHQQCQTEPLSSARDVGIAVTIASGLGKSGYTGALFIPTATGTLKAKEMVTYNDADWIDAENAAGFEFVHPGISNDAAAALGVRSLQRLLNANIEFCGELRCPDVVALRSVLVSPNRDRRQASLLDTVYNIIEAADLLGNRSVSVAIDERTLPTQSVLQPSLRRVHNNALVITIPDLVLTPQAVADLFDPTRFRMQNPRLGHAVGQGFSAAFRVADVVSVLSGEHLTFLDPTGAFVSKDFGSSESSSGSSGGGSKNDGRTSVGKSYSISGLCNQFPHQFQVYSQFGFRGGGNHRGTIIRLPSRDATFSPFATQYPGLCWNVEEVRIALFSFKSVGAEPLLFASSLSSLSVERYGGPPPVGATPPAIEPSAASGGMPSAGLVDGGQTEESDAGSHPGGSIGSHPDSSAGNHLMDSAGSHPGSNSISRPGNPDGSSMGNHPVSGGACLTETGLPLQALAQPLPPPTIVEWIGTYLNRTTSVPSYTVLKTAAIAEWGSEAWSENQNVIRKIMMKHVAKSGAGAGAGAGATGGVGNARHPLQSSAASTSASIQQQAPNSTLPTTQQPTSTNAPVHDLILKVTLRPGQHNEHRIVVARTQSWKSRFTLRGITHQKVSEVYEMDFDTFSGSDGTPSVESWIVSQAIGSSIAQDLSYNESLRHLFLKPAVGAAVNVSRIIALAAADKAHARDETEGASTVYPAISGKLFCGGPLPDVTGLPVHVYGHFVRSSSGTVLEAASASSAANPSSAANGATKLLTDWNELLFESLSKPVARVLERLSYNPLVEKDPIMQYAAWPRFNIPRFVPMCAKLYAKLASYKIFFKATGERCNMSDGYFLTQRAEPELRKWLSASFENLIEIELICLVWCAFFDRNLHSTTPLVPTPARLKLVQACEQCHSSRVSTFLTSAHCKLRPNTEGRTGED